VTYSVKARFHQARRPQPAEPMQRHEADLLFKFRQLLAETGRAKMGLIEARRMRFIGPKSIVTLVSHGLVDPALDPPGTHPPDVMERLLVKKWVVIYSLAGGERVATLAEGRLEEVTSQAERVARLRGSRGFKIIPESPPAVSRLFKDIAPPL